MKLLNGKYSTAKVYANVIEQEAIDQIQKLIDNKLSLGSNIALMPDCHAGKGCTIGTTMTITDKVCPNLVGVDIGCGVTSVKTDLKYDDIDFGLIDTIIRKVVPLGTSVHKESNDEVEWLSQLHCYDKLVNIDRIKKSVGSLGGGNHYIELNKDSNDSLWITVHTGSRNLGQQVAMYYQSIAERNMIERNTNNYQDKIEELKRNGESSKIQEFISKNKPKKLTKTDLELAYIDGEDMQNYLDDIAIVQDYADYNRGTILYNIIKALNCNVLDVISSIHNYIDVDNMILRKGAISAQKDEVVIIPLNMEDGAIIAKGKGNKEWNYSAPHGAGRIMSRKKAKEVIDVESVKESMNNAGVYTTSINSNTIDEAKSAYKNPKDIIDVVGDTLEIIEVIKPVYNLKG